ncbi:MAG TPA: vWA domain-containing protein, partial [Planctomycetota bacterium]|nr:vWA domain-containing protein [Planctomycetota bacterium]
GFVLRPTRDPLDTIFFLTDGEPTVGRTVDMREIRNEVRRVNGYRGVQIHVIYVGEFGGEEMEKLAHENGGVFVSIGG